MCTDENKDKNKKDSQPFNSSPRSAPVTFFLIAEKL